MEKKYVMTNETKTLENGKILHRIRSIATFGNVKKGDLGGWIEKEENLSHKGTCWIYNDAMVYGNARVCEHAEVTDTAQILDDAMVYNYARVFGNARICGDAHIGLNSSISGNAYVWDSVPIDTRPSIPEGMSKTISGSLAVSCYMI